MRTPYELPEMPRRNPWPYRIALFLSWVVVGLAGAMLLSGWFGYLDKYLSK